MTVITRLLRLLLWTGATYPTLFGSARVVHLDIAEVSITRTFAWRAAGCQLPLPLHFPLSGWVTAGATRIREP
ncbi:hypothetical protein SAMN05216228_104218 [Rhizobium tibeticum]|uniref:Uncharacterized protein n=1 Tax=Rhizobium tibeticum TaxID=501024 RepID=A0A1H8VFR7_9HYPH|nr:hypothetical protein RTCCBAU85039_6035 [Rhizobium tibeticum]SEP14239.1 hypothetical protein SAMN05216228_104218 [Rhizobium tibeticum]